MKDIVFSIGDLLLFTNKYYKDIGIITDLHKEDIVIEWHSIGEQRLAANSISKYITERDTYFHYPVVK
jgi:hypothetical protein